VHHLFNPYWPAVAQLGLVRQTGTEFDAISKDRPRGCWYSRCSASPCRGGLFLYWAANDFTTLAAALHDRFALAFIADLLVTTGALTVYFAKRPPGRYRWPWFLALSLLSTLAFGLAMYLWLNRRTHHDDAI
jgi:hypothetical protein